MKKVYALFLMLFSLFLVENVTAQCTHSIQLTDTYGDGWNGGRVSVSVNGVVVLSNLGSTFTTGLTGPTFTFSAASGATIRVYTTTTGSFFSEMRVRVFGPLGNVINTVQPPTGTATTGGVIGIGSCSGGSTINVPLSGSNSVSCGTNVTLFDHAGTANYSNNANGFTVLNNAGTGVITLSGTSSGESCCDYVRIFRGSGISGTLVGTYYMNTSIPVITSVVGEALTVQFVSDGSIVGAGFTINVTYSGSCVTSSCTGTPSAGTSSINLTSGCIGTSVSLSAIGLSTGTGISYQWQSATNSGGPWTNLVGATSSTFSTTPSATTFYRIFTSCSNSGASNISNTVSFTSSSCINVPYTGSNSVSCGTNLTLYDHGGSTGNYSDLANGFTVLNNAGTGVITLSGTSSGESCCDYVRIFRGSGTAGVLIGTYFMNTTIPTITSNPGEALTVQFISDGSVTGIGFSINATYSGSCVCPGTSVLLTMNDTWGDGWNGGQLTLQESGGVVYGPYTLSTGTTATQTICLPNGCYRVILSGGTYPTEISWSLTNGATTYASASAPNAAPFNTIFTIGAVSCPATPSNNLCSNASVIDLGVNPNQNHSGTGVGSTNTLGLSQFSETWVAIVVPCGGMNISMNLCSNTTVRNNAYLNLFSTCAANPSFTTATNYNFTNCTNGSITLNWNNLPAGTYYYPILIDNLNWGASYTLNVVGTPLFTNATAPTSITGITTICSGESTTLTIQGGSAGTNGTVEWFSGLCGSTVIGTGNSLVVSPTSNTTYFARYISSCNTTSCVSVLVTVNNTSTPPTLNTIPGSICPNTNVTLVASGGISGTGAQVAWYTGPNGTGTFLGYGNSLTLTPIQTETIYARREGTCNTTTDVQTTVNVMSYVYSSNITTSNNFCIDNSGWRHFHIGNELIFSVQGDFSNCPSGYPIVTISNNNSFYQQNMGTSQPTACTNGLTPGEERFEMSRSWNLDMGGGSPIGGYNVRFYYQLNEKQAIETASANWISSYPDCNYQVKYATTNGFYWFKNTGSNYIAPQYDGTQFIGIGGTTNNGVNYVQLNGLISFSGGSGAIILVPDQTLPIEWQSFKGTTDNKYNYLEWVTASEQNTQSFEIQRSKDGINFENIGTKLAAGMSYTPKTYNFIDRTPLVGENYYRINMIENTENTTHSNVIVLEINKQSSGYFVYPNPTTEFITLEIESDNMDLVDIQVLDILGRVVLDETSTITEGKNQLKINLNELLAGNYSLKVFYKNTSRVIIEKIVKM